MITPDGWLDWAIRLEPTNRHINPGINTVKGAFFHSAEGYASVLLDPNSEWGYNGKHSWHGSNLMDGRFIQHFPFTARCWHATAANNDYIGIENEGYSPREKSLNEAQIANLVRLVQDLEEWKGWRASRPRSATDTTHTLWEHNEVVRLGGTGSTCPNGRIPWNTIMGLLKEEEDMVIRNPDGSPKQGWVPEGHRMVLYNESIPVLFVGDKTGAFPGQISKNFGGTEVFLANGGDPDNDGKGEAFWTLESRD